MTKNNIQTDALSLSNQHLIGIENLSVDDINIILDRADYYANALPTHNYDNSLLQNKIIVSLFFEDSTRTRLSFDIAAQRLGAHVINLEMKHSSLNKGESFEDTILNINAMRPDGIIIRHSEYGAPVVVSKIVNCPVINAGDSWREHPTQALLDALTIRRALGTIKNKTIAICGDIAHSRVAASNMILLRKLGANVNVVAPPTLMPQKFPADGIKSFDNLKDGLMGCDIVMMLRNQKERMQAGLIASEEAFHREFGLTKEKLAYANEGAFVLHPGPLNRGVEIDDDVADDKKHSLILEQVKNGVATRMAVMDLLIGKNK